MKKSRSKIFGFHYDYFFLFVFDRYILLRKNYLPSDKMIKKEQVEKYMYK